MSNLAGYIKQASEHLWLVIVLLLAIPPLGIYLLWKGEHFAKKTRKIVSIVATAWFLLYLIDAAMEPVGQSGDYGSCSATFYENGCTYYRDDNCNVVAKSCD